MRHRNGGGCKMHPPLEAVKDFVAVVRALAGGASAVVDLVDVYALRGRGGGGVHLGIHPFAEHHRQLVLSDTATAHGHQDFDLTGGVGGGTGVD